MQGAHDTQSTPGNWLLAALPTDARDALVARATRIPLRAGDLIAKADEPIENAYFPNAGVISIAAKIADGHTVEMGTIGWEGFFSPGFVLGVAHTVGESTVQVDGDGWVLPRRAFLEWYDAHPQVAPLFLRYVNGWWSQVGIHAACNAVHTVDERLARWILLSHDRMPTDSVPLTHEFLSIMLGVRRASVSLAASLAREAGLIDYTRGRIRVTNRGGLEMAACPCYFAIRRAFDDMGIPRLVDHSATRGSVP